MAADQPTGVRGASGANHYCLEAGIARRGID
jgi:hypothetical protein